MTGIRVREKKLPKKVPTKATNIFTEETGIRTRIRIRNQKKCWIRIRIKSMLIETLFECMGGGRRWALASAQCDISFKEPSIIRPISIDLNHRVYRVPGFLSSRPNWVPPPPSAARQCCSLSPLCPRGEAHSLAGEGVAELVHCAVGTCALCTVYTMQCSLWNGGQGGAALFPANL